MSKHEKVICLISPSLQMGGLERAASNLANYFNSKGFKVIYIVLYSFKKFFELDSGIVLIEPDLNYRSSNKFSYYLNMIPYLRKAVKKYKPNTILTLGEYHNALVLFALQGIDIPIHVSDRSSPNKKFGQLFTIFRKWIYKKSSGVIAQTETAAAQKRRMLGLDFRISVIPNAIRNVKRYSFKREKIILGVGRHYHVKGMDRLIKAFWQLNDNEWVLHLAGGNGPETNNLKDLVIKLELEEKVVFLGELKNIDEEFSKSSIFVMTSRSEGFPNALCEAMASGLPCISYDIVAGPSDIISHNENGILIPDGDTEKLTSAISTLMRSQKKRNQLGENALKVQDEFSNRNSGDKYLQFILSLST